MVKRIGQAWRIRLLRGSYQATPLYFIYKYRESLYSKYAIQHRHLIAISVQIKELANGGVKR